MKRSLLNTSLFVVLFFNVLPSFSQLNTLCISGKVTRMEDHQNVLTDIVSLDDAFEGTLTYDLSIVDNNGLAVVGDYYNSSSLTGIHIAIGDQVFETNSSNVHFLVETVDNYYSQDNLVFRSYYNVFTPAIPGVGYDTHIGLQLDDTTETAISTIDLPASINISDWQQPFGLDITGSNNYYFSHIDTSIYIRAMVTHVNTCPNRSILDSSTPSSGKNNLTVYPNPFQQNATLQFDYELNNATVSVYTVQGEKVLSYDNVSGNNLNISRGNLPNGVYVVQLMKEDQSSSTGKIIITDK